MKALSYIQFLISICILFIGCSYYSKNLPVDYRYEATDPKKIAIFEEIPNRPYEIVGKVHSHCRRNWCFGLGGCTKGKMIKFLKEEASRLGADAIIDIKKERFSQLEWTDVHYHAIAVRLK